MATSSSPLASANNRQHHRAPPKNKTKSSLIKKGRSALAMGDWRTAEAEFRELLKIDRSLPQAYSLLYQAVLLSDQPTRFSLVVMESIKHSKAEPNFARLYQSIIGISKHDSLTIVREALKKWPDSDAFNHLLSSLTDSELQSKHKKTAIDICHDALVLATENKRAQALELLAANKESCNEKERNQLKNIESVIRSLPNQEDLKLSLIHI